MSSLQAIWLKAVVPEMLSTVCCLGSSSTLDVDFSGLPRPGCTLGVMCGCDWSIVVIYSTVIFCGKPTVQIIVSLTFFFLIYAQRTKIIFSLWSAMGAMLHQRRWPLFQVPVLPSPPLSHTSLSSCFIAAIVVFKNGRRMSRVFPSSP